MKKILYIFIACSIALSSCRHNHSHDHEHEGESHEHHEHEGDSHEHDHEGDSHEGHSHEGHSHGNHNHDEGDDNAKGKHPGAIAFTKEQSSRIDFATELPIMEPMGQVIKTTAQILSDQTDETIIAARTAGIVLFAGNSIVEGKNVTSGQELFSVSGAGMAENSVNVRLSEAQSSYTKAETDYLKAQDLAKDQIISEKELRQIRSDYETAKAIYDNLYKNFSGNGQRVSSPANGFVKQLFVSNGQYVDAGQPLVSISKNKSLLLKADVQSRYAPLLPRIVSANFNRPNDPEIYTLEALNGKVLSFGKSVNENNYLIPVSFLIDNKAGFIPGSFVEVYIKTKSEQPVLNIPKESLVESQGIFFVFVQTEPELYEKREVKPGVTDGVRTEIISGLSLDDRVVTKGAVSVKLAESSGTLDPHAGHVH